MPPTCARSPAGRATTRSSSCATRRSRGTSRRRSSSRPATSARLRTPSGTPSARTPAQGLDGNSWAAPSYSSALMATRTIVTSQPPVVCDVCERRLLRGEHPELFLAAGQPRTVCELCVPRAVHHGWLRESEQPLPAPPAPRQRRGRSLFERLRAGGRPGADARPAAAQAAHGTIELEPYDFLGSDAEADAASAADERGAGEPSAARLAVEAFNAGEHPRRIA